MTSSKPSRSVAALKRELARAAQGEQAGYLAWFKTGKGDYAERDRFMGIRIPAQRAIADKYRDLGLEEIATLLESRVHEHRFTGLLILVARYERGDEATRQRVYRFYLDHTRRIDNWDLVDVSAPFVVGEHLLFRSRRVLYRLARSPNWWERRIAVVATSAFIDRGDLQETFVLANRLLDDEHDLVRKATGWMLREAGDRSRPRLLAFLERHQARMPRVTLRYAIEHLPEPQRRRALRGLFA